MPARANNLKTQKGREVPRGRRRVIYNIADMNKVGHVMPLPAADEAMIRSAMNARAADARGTPLSGVRAIDGARVRQPRGDDAPLMMQPVSTEAWDRSVTDFDDICQEQTYVFASQRWPSVVPEPVLFSLRQEIVGGALVMVVPMPLALGGVALVNRGPMLRRAQAADRAALHSSMIDLLVGEYAAARGMMLSIQLRAPLSADEPHQDQLLARNFRPGAKLAFPDRYVVGLELSEHEHRKGLRQKWRYHLAKAEKEGLVFEHAGAEAMQRFALLYEAMSERKRFPDYSAYPTLASLLASKDLALRPQLFFASHGGETVAGAAIFTDGQTATYLYGATNDRALPLRAGYFLHWNIIRWLKRHTRARWYDLGGNDGFSGLHQFKKGLVGTAGVIAPMPPWLNTAAGRVPYVLGCGAFAARDTLSALRRMWRMSRDRRPKPDLVPGQVAP